MKGEAPSLALLIADKVSKGKPWAKGGGSRRDPEADEPEAKSEGMRDAKDEPDEEARGYADDLMRAFKDEDLDGIVEAIRGICG